jgi:flagellar FliJ protein
MSQGGSFKFRLEALLNYRKRVLDMCEQGLGEARRLLRAAEDWCVYLRGERDACRQAISVAGPDGRLDVDDANDMDLRIQYLGGAIDRQQEVLWDCETQVEARRIDVVDASKRRKVVERLREHAHADFMGELTIEERKFFDEVGSVRAARARNENLDTGAGIQRVTQ